MRDFIGFINSLIFYDYEKILLYFIAYCNYECSICLTKSS